MEFLSDEWCAAANSALKHLDTADIELTVAYVSEISSHCIVLSNGRASVSREVHSPDITLRQATDTTNSLRQGSLSALTAIQEGLVAVEGDVGRLVAAKEALTAIDKILSDLTPSDPS
ncbi:MAG: SCP2 sterol-binding domain-containing protein [Actinomycetota bacterium]|nr:SCP2 sterol-binding domain-containing protein [Actinomycetota bacterium]MEC9059104.1 SCP2 sterol-binding domain-containing protein [Actinomycetota bacterium]